MTLYGFRDREIAVTLKEMAENRVQLVPASGNNLRAPIIDNTCYIKINEDIPKATRTSSPYSITPGKVTGTLCNINNNDDITEYLNEDGVTVDIEVCNHYENKILIVQDEIVIAHQTRFGNYVLDYTQNKPFAEFTLGDVLSSSSASVSATLVLLWGQGLKHNLTTVYNTREHSSGTYKYSGDSGDYGEARWSPVDEKWYIVQLECP